MHLFLFFTYGVSLARWDELGLLDRELRLYLALAERGHCVTFITYGGAEDRAYQGAWKGIDILPLYDGAWRPGNRVLRLLHSVFLPFRIRHRFSEADLFKTNQLMGAWNALLAKRLSGKPLLVRLGFDPCALARREGRSWPIRALLRLLARSAYRGADKVALASEREAESIMTEFHLPSGLVGVAPNYVDTDHFSPGTDGTSPPPRSALFVGRLTAVKNLPAILDAFADSPYTLSLAGDGEDAPALRRRAEERRLPVFFLGRVPHHELPALIRRHRFLLLCSHSEGQPKAILEAMACARPVLGSDVPGIRDLIRHGETGLLCGLDSASIRKGISILMEDDALSLRLGRAARSFALERHALPACVEKEETLLTDTLARAAVRYGRQG